jgi:AdoMet-dependent rRNA methyltransferase SPB1
LLAKANIVNKGCHRWLALDMTTGDIKANCDDLKVLGKGDFKALLKWRLAIREEVKSIITTSISNH